MKKLKVSILGCGWLGMPLLKSLVAEGHEVSGTSRDPQKLEEIEAAGARPYRLNLPREVPTDFRPDFREVLIITLPPRGRTLGEAAAANYLACLEAIPMLRTRSCPSVIFTSSTGIYGNAEGLVTEQSVVAPATHSARAVTAAEVWLASTPTDFAIMRLAGLVAPDRHPGRFFGGRARPIPQANALVNLVHREDVIAAIHLLLAKGWQRGEVYNVCAAAHPTKGDFYTAAAKSLGLEIAGTTPGGADGKVIDSSKLRALGWQPKWDDLSLTSL